MLKAMRKNIKSLAPTLWIVIAAFIIAIFAVWGGAGRLGERERANTIATVGKVKIPIDLYTRNLMQKLENMRRSNQKIDRQLILQIDAPQTLGQLIVRTLLLQAAREAGLNATDEEIRDQIINYSIVREDGTPAFIFQKNGEFIGFDEYRKILEWSHLSISDFEEGLREEVIMEKYRKLITAGISVTQEEIWENYKKENESANLEYILLEIDKIELKNEPTDREMQQHFEKNRKKYKIPEKREGEYIFFKTDDLKTEIELAESEIENYYKKNLSQFEEPERIKVSRIYLPYGTREKGVVLAEAESILERIKKGEDFPELAKKYSRDKKAEDGGDWGYYDWNRLSPAETEKIRKMSQGEISSVLELEYGASLIKVSEKKPAVIKPFEEVKERIRTILEEEKARKLADTRITHLEKSARREKSLDVAAQKMDLKIRKTGQLEKGDSIQDIDPTGLISRALFDLQEKEITSPVYTYKGVGIAQLEKINPPREANFEEVKDKVRVDVLEIKKQEKALETIKKARAQLMKKSMEKVAENFKLEYKTAEKHKWDQYLSQIGENPEIDRLVFSLPPGKVSDPVEYEKGYALMRVLDRKEVTQEDFQKTKEEERKKLLERKSNIFLSSYILTLRKIIGVKEDYNIFLKVTNDILSRYEEK